MTTTERRTEHIRVDGKTPPAKAGEAWKLTIVPMLANGKWGERTENLWVFKEKVAPIVYDNMAAIKQGREFEVEIELLPMASGRGNYKHLRAIKTFSYAAKKAAEESEPFPGGAQPPGEPAQSPQEAPQRRASPQPAQSNGGAWREAYSQSREAQEAQRESIEAQVSVIQAREFLDRIIPMELSMEEKVGLFTKHLPVVAHIIHATISEVKHGRKE